MGNEKDTGTTTTMETTVSVSTTTPTTDQGSSTHLETTETTAAVPTLENSTPAPTTSTPAVVVPKKKPTTVMAPWAKLTTPPSATSNNGNSNGNNGWLGSQNNINNNNNTMTKKKTFAEIMAEQSQDRAAAQVAYGGDEHYGGGGGGSNTFTSLADIEAEQELAFQKLKEQQQQQNSSKSSNASNSSKVSSQQQGNSTATKTAATTVSKKDPENMTEEELMEWVMQQSLAEYEQQQGQQQQGQQKQHSTAIGENGNNVAVDDDDNDDGKPAAKASSKSNPQKSQDDSDYSFLDNPPPLSVASVAASASAPAAAAAVASSVAAAATTTTIGDMVVETGMISKEEADLIEAAIREADAQEAAMREAQDKELMESLMLAERLQMEDYIQAGIGVGGGGGQRRQQGNVRSMTRAQLEYESERVSNVYQGSNNNNNNKIDASHASSTLPHPLEMDPTLRSVLPHRHAAGDNDNDDDDFEDEPGFRMNSSTPQQQWTRRDRNTIIGPNGEVRSKHDVHAQGQANAHMLGLDPDDFGMRAHVGNKAFNSFKKNMKRTTKGVATHGTGRAGSDADATKGKALDTHVRIQISRAINADLIEKCNGVVKQGKEAMIYHANQGKESHGFDVAVKVFKRITEFRGRADYVEGDPRYANRAFRKASEREQLEIWTEKEYRNLIRANRAKVPVPIPLLHKENILFMRFLGDNGWPAPQIREIEIRKGSKKWALLYSQVMESIRRLYKDGRLVHGDLSEYNILIAPVLQVDHPIKIITSDGGDNNNNVDENTGVSELQPVLIDFGQAVDVRHPESSELLTRDLDRVRSFFVRQGVENTLSVTDAYEMVTRDVDVNDEYDDDDDDNENEYGNEEKNVVLDDDKKKNHHDNDNEDNVQENVCTMSDSTTPVVAAAVAAPSVVTTTS